MAKKKEEIVELILTQHQRLTPAAEELRKKLNGIVAEYKLNSNDVLRCTAEPTLLCPESLSQSSHHWWLHPSAIS